MGGADTVTLDKRCICKWYHVCPHVGVIGHVGCHEVSLATWGCHWPCGVS